MKWIIGELVTGDHIRVNRGFYFHHGVYVGNGQVIHYTAADGDGMKNPSEVEVRITSLDFFANNCIVEKCELEGKEKRERNSVKAIIKIAFDSLGTKGYNILHNNCEDFANRCCYKKPLTSQIKDFKEKI